MELFEFYCLYTLNTLVLTGGFLYSFKRKRVYSALWVGLLGLHILPISTLTYLVDLFGISILLWGQFLMLVGNGLMFFIICLLDQLVLPLNKTKLNAIYHQEAHIPVYYFFLMLILAISALGIRFRGGFDIFYSNWSIDRLSSGYLEALSVYLGFIFIPSTWRAYRSHQYIWVILLGSAAVTFFFIAGSRAMLLTLVFAIYATLLISSLRLRRKLILLGIVSVLGFAIHTGARLTRGMGLGGFIDAVRTGEIITHFSSQDSIDFSGGEANIYEWYNYALKVDYDFPPYKSGVTLIRLATIYIPRSIFPYRPLDITHEYDAQILVDGALDDHPSIAMLKEALRNGGGGSTHPNLWGDAYLNMGWLGFFIYPFLIGILLILLERFLQRLSPLAFLTIVPIVGIGQFDIARGTVVAGFSHIAYTIPLIFMIFLATGLALGILPRIKFKFTYAQTPIFG